MILTHESGAQEDQFDEKKWRQKISWYYPFKIKPTNEYTKDHAGWQGFAVLSLATGQKDVIILKGKRHVIFTE
jgi:hypothetical protein